MSNQQAPVCHVSQDEQIDQHKSPLVTSIPEATDLATALAAIRALTQNMNALTGRIGANGVRGPAGRNGAPGQAAPHNTRWSEAKRVKSTKTITDSTGQFSVVVEQITGLTMVDKVTGEVWTWSQ